MIEDQTENGALIDALENYSKPIEIHRDDNVIVHLVGNEEVNTYLGASYPKAASGNHPVDDTKAMCELVAQIKANDLTGVVTYCERTKMRVTTVLNDHTTIQYNRRDHRVVYELKATPAWAAWQHQDRKMMGQESFAEFVENNMPAIVDPPAADMLEIAQTFAAVGTIEFRGAKRLTSGVTQMTYSEELTASGGGNGQLDIPGKFRLLLVPYVGSKPAEVVVRFRYRLRDGKVSLGFIIDDPVGVADTAFAQAQEQIEEAASWLVIPGSPDVS